MPGRVKTGPVRWTVAQGRHPPNRHRRQDKPRRGGKNVARAARPWSHGDSPDRSPNGATETQSLPSVAPLGLGFSCSDPSPGPDGPGYILMAPSGPATHLKQRPSSTDDWMPAVRTKDPEDLRGRVLAGTLAQVVGQVDPVLGQLYRVVGQVDRVVAQLDRAFAQLDRPFAQLYRAAGRLHLFTGALRDPPTTVTSTDTFCASSVTRLDVPAGPRR